MPSTVPENDESPDREEGKASSSPVIATTVSTAAAKTASPPRKRKSSDASSSPSRKKKSPDAKSDKPAPPLRLNHRLFTLPSTTRKKRVRKPPAGEIQYLDERVVKGSIASLVLERIGGTRPSDILPDLSDDETSFSGAKVVFGGVETTTVVVNTSSPPAKPPPKSRAKGATLVPPQQSFWGDDPSSDESSETPYRPQVRTKVWFRSTVRPQRRPRQASPPKSQERTRGSSPMEMDEVVPEEKEDSINIEPAAEERADDKSAEKEDENQKSLQKKRNVPTMKEIKETFLTSVSRQFHNSIQDGTTALLKARLSATQAPLTEATDKSVSDANAIFATKDRELKEILKASAQTKSFGSQMFSSVTLALLLNDETQAKKL